MKTLDLSTITYQEFKEISNKKFNQIPLHYFFSKEQQQQVYKKLNITTENASDKLYRAFDGVVLKKDAYLIKEFIDWKTKASEALQLRENYLYQMYFYEFGNHEAHIAHSYEDVFNDFTDNPKSELAIKVYKKAKKDHWEYVVKNDYF